MRYRYVSAVVVFLLMGLVGGHQEGDLPFFDIARHALLSHQGLQLYATHPNIQIGPLALLGVMAANALLFGQLTVAVVVLAAVLLLLMLRTTELLALDAGVEPTRARTAVAFGGLVLAATWAVAVPGWGHPDDLAALLAMTAALRAARRGQELAAGLLLAAGVDCKPWAAFAVAIVLVLPGARQRWRASAGLAAGIAVCWAPFLLGAPGSLGALARFQIVTNPFSLPGLLGAGEDPHWTRLAQLTAASVAVVVCLRLGRWQLALLLVAVARLALDGGDFPYYDVELIAGCFVADATLAGREGPLLTACAPLTVLSFIGMDLVHQIAYSDEAVPARLGLYVVLIAVGGLLARPRAMPTVAAPSPGDASVLVG